MEMPAEHPGRDMRQPLRVIDEAEVLLDLDVPKVVPIADEFRRIDLIEQGGQFRLAGDFLEARRLSTPSLISFCAA